jgi:hypothetical protein
LKKRNVHQSSLLHSESESETTKNTAERNLPPLEYEKMLIKLEGEVRNHIKVE